MNHARPLLIGIAGGSGSGKTWLSRRIAMAFPGRVARVSLDDFYRDRSHLAPGTRRRINYDHPRAIDWPLLRQFLESYRDGARPILPRYDFTTHSRSQSVPCELKPILVMEGLWTLARRELRQVFDTTIYLDCPSRLRLERRITRDTTERGRTAQEVRTQFRQSVAPMHTIHVVPQKQWATTVLTHPIAEAQVEELLAQLRARLQRGSPLILPAPVYRWQEQRDWRDVA
jgi:uridine kinase